MTFLDRNESPKRLRLKEYKPAEARSPCNFPEVTTEPHLGSI